MEKAHDQWRTLEQFFLTRKDRLTPKIKIDFQVGRYRIKLADDFDELGAAFLLRHEIFYRELSQQSLPLGMDIDVFDFDSDHLVIIDNRNKEVVGTYRLRCSQFVNHFYTETEFTLDNFIRWVPGIKTEIGRACVHRDHRKGSVIHLLWRGITEYVKQTQTQYLFGCSSIPILDSTIAKSLTSYFQELGALENRWEIKTKAPAPNESQSPCLSMLLKEDLKKQIPPLIQFYLRSGAKLIGDPSWDENLKCIGFFTLIEMNRVDEKCQRKYQLLSSPQTY